MSGVKRKRKVPSQLCAEGEDIPPRTKRAKPHQSKSCDITEYFSCGPLDALSHIEEEDEKLGKLSKFRISKATRRKLKSRGVKFLFPIQYLTFDHIFEGRDVIGQARTGTGKTLSFVLPLLERLSSEGSEGSYKGRPPAVLVMAPTRELANQVHVEFKALSPEGISSFCIYGGTLYEPQEVAMRAGIDVLVGTPGRILDHMSRGNLDLTQLKHVVLDEADQMLERGFAETVEEILDASFTPARDSKPQLLLFSATVPEWVRETAERYMSPDHILIDLIGQQRVRTAVTVEHKAISCPYTERPSTIADVIQVYSGAHGRTMVFAATKKETNELALSSALKQDCQALHGDIPQKQREITLKSFREGKFPVLVATDVAARGLDVPEVDLVIQCEPPKDVDAYIHRSGRTGRAGRTGVSIMFYKPQQEFMVPLVERRAGIRFQRIGAPQPSDVVKAGAHDAVRSLDEVPSAMLPHFREAAELLIKQKGATDALAAALAYISGSKEIISRSLLSAQQGFTTYHMHCSEMEVRGPGYFWKILERCFPPEVKEAVRRMRMSKDSKGVVFDLPSELDSTVKDHWQDGHVRLCVPTVLPELKERPPDYYVRQGGVNGYGHGRGNHGYGFWRTAGHNGGGSQARSQTRNGFRSKFSRTN